MGIRQTIIVLSMLPETTIESSGDLIEEDRCKPNTSHAKNIMPCHSSSSWDGSDRSFLTTKAYERLATSRPLNPDPVDRTNGFERILARIF